MKTQDIQRALNQNIITAALPKEKKSLKNKNAIIG
jgi:hypothetical protein